MVAMYELTEAYRAVLEMAQSGEIDDEQAIADTLGAIEGDITLKAESCAVIIGELTAQTDKLAAEEKRLHTRRKSIENSIERIKSSIFDGLKATGKDKLRTDLFSFSIRKNPPKVVIDDISAVPQEFIIPQPPKIDNTSVKAYLKSELSEPCNWAHIEQGESLSIR